MKSIIYSGAQDVRVEEKPLPEIGAGEVLIKVAYVGVCGSDMNIYQGVHPRAKAPLVMGHEFSGTIVAGHPTLQGDRMNLIQDTRAEPERSLK